MLVLRTTFMRTLLETYTFLAVMAPSCVKCTHTLCRAARRLYWLSTATHGRAPQAAEGRARLAWRRRRLKDAHGLLAVKESAYNKARTAAEAGRGKLPALQGQASEAARAAHASALAAQEHAGGAPVLAMPN